MKLIEITRELFDYLVAFRRRVSQSSAPNIDIVQHELELIFRAMEEKITRHPKLSGEYRQVKYPLVVLADEIILTSAWAHAKRWEQCLLEKKYFASNIGGNQFFKLLAKVERMPRSVVTVFYYCLAFGFRGGFAHNDPSLIRLKGRLLQRILPAKEAEDNLILPEAYHVERTGTGKLPIVWKWRHIIISAVVLFIVLLAIQRLVIWPIIIGQSLDAVAATDPEALEVGPSAGEASQGSSASKSGYTVQLGLFSSETLAMHFSQQMALKGIKARIHYKVGADGKQQYLVLSGTFKNREDATKLLREAKSASTLVSEMSVLPWEQVSGDCVHGCE